MMVKELISEYGNAGIGAANLNEATTSSRRCLQSMLVTPDAYDYAVQLTMDPPQTGGLSGATLDEARSWANSKRMRETSLFTPTPP